MEDHSKQRDTQHSVMVKSRCSKIRQNWICILGLSYIRICTSTSLGKLPIISSYRWGLPWCLSSKESTCQCKRCNLIPGSGRSPGGGNDNPLQYSYLRNPMDRGAWRATAHGVARVRHDLTTKQQQMSMGKVLRALLITSELCREAGMRQ